MRHKTKDAPLAPTPTPVRGVSGFRSCRPGARDEEQLPVAASLPAPQPEPHAGVRLAGL